MIYSSFLLLLSFIFGQQRYMAAANKDDLPPHVYKIADLAYENMVRGGEPQCFVISGNK